MLLLCTYHNRRLDAQACGQRSQTSARFVFTSKEDAVAVENDIKPNTSRGNVTKKEGDDVAWKKANSMNGDNDSSQKDGRMVTTNTAKGKTA